MCEQQYYIEYILGLRGPSNKKADKGTITHKVLEILAHIKKAIQDKKDSIEDDILGKISNTEYDLDSIIERVYSYYTEKFAHHKWDPVDFKDCKNWVYKAISFNSGMFDPRNRIVLCPEQHFDLIIDKPWAEYSFDTEDGKITGNLGLKGTIDLITEIDDNTIEVIDWKTGKRLDWATGQEKTFSKLQTDPQLMIYHYAIRHIFPQYDHIILTIYFINDGGPFSILFDKKDLLQTENMIREKFESIKRTKKPKLNKTWMCNKLCHFGKTTFDNNSILPIVEYRDNQTCKKGSFMTKCEQIKHEIGIKGIDSVSKEYTSPNHSVANYKAPGSVE